MNMIHEKNIFSKIVISKKGKINLIMCDPSKKTQKIDHTYVVFENQNYYSPEEFKNYQMEIEILSLTTIYEENFQTPDKAILIGDTIFVKGAKSKILRIKPCLDEKDNKWKYEILGKEKKPVELPYEDDCIINVCQQFYRINTAESEIQDKELKFPDQLQVSYARKATVYNVDQIETIENKKKDHQYETQYFGIDLLFDPEKYIDTGISLSKMSKDLENDAHKEMINIWTHINSNMSKEFYYVY